MQMFNKEITAIAEENVISVGLNMIPADTIGVIYAIQNSYGDTAFPVLESDFIESMMKFVHPSPTIILMHFTMYPKITNILN